MDKKTALEYIVGQGKRVTAKVVSIDLDAPISTTTELLERMSAQGLLERDRDQRPREYAVTEDGRKRLEFFKARAAAETPPAEPNRNANPGGPASGVAASNPGPHGAASGEKLDALREEICSRLDAVREDLADLVDVLAAKPSSAAPAPTGNPSSRVAGLLARAGRFTQGEGKSSANPEPKPSHPKVREYYEACGDLDNASWFQNPARGRKVADLEAEIPAGVVASVKRLRDLESPRSWLDESMTPEAEKEIARLRVELGLDSHDGKSAPHPVAEVRS